MYASLICIILLLSNVSYGQETKCNACNKIAYPTESIDFSSRHWHKTCFKCSKCNAALKLTTVKIDKETLFCTNCYTPSTTNASVDTVISMNQSTNSPVKSSESLVSVNKKKIEGLIKLNGKEVWLPVQESSKNKYKVFNTETKTWVKPEKLRTYNNNTKKWIYSDL